MSYAMMAPGAMQMPAQGQMGAPQAGDTLDVAVVVPGSSVAKIIGKAGAGLKAIRESCGCKINVQAAGADPNANRRIDLIGQASSVGQGAGAVLATAYQGQASVEAVVMIPEKRVGAVIGKGGAKLKSVRETYNVRIQVEREPSMNPLTGEAERMLTVSGEPRMCGSGLALALGGASPGVMGGLPGAARNGGAMPGLGGPGAAGAPQSGMEVRNMGDDPDAVQIHLVIPGKLTGAIVGKQGATIQGLAAQAGCTLAVSKRTDSANRRIICIGSPAAVITGQQLVHNAALQLCDVSGVDKDQLSNMTAIFWIPTESSGAIIGKAGATLGQIREESLVKVDFAKEEVKSMRPCSITGPLQNIIHAETFIFNVLANARTTQMNGGGKRTMEGPSDGSKRMRLGDQGGGEQTKLLIPARNAGAVIGKQGSGLGRIREECGVKVDMQQQAQAPQWPEDRVLILQGPSANRTAAITSVLQATMQGGTETDCELKMLVSRAEAGAIIGKQGSTLKHIRETTGISTQVEQNEVMGERLVRCSGAPLSVMNVVRLIMDVLAQGSQGGGNGGASMMGPIMPFA